jgi:hypothetical protein
MTAYGNQNNDDLEPRGRWQDTAERLFNRPVRVTDAAGGVTGRINPNEINDN